MSSSSVKLDVCEACFVRSADPIKRPCHAANRLQDADGGDGPRSFDKDAEPCRKMLLKASDGLSSSSRRLTVHDRFLPSRLDESDG